MKSEEYEIVESVGIISINNIYTITQGSHSGEKIMIKWICPNKQIHIGNNKMRRQVYGTLIQSNAKINTVLEFLQEYIDANKPKSNYKILDNFKLILLCKKRDKEAILEFVKRFKKLPKI
jgi:hypothetical protein